MKIKEALIQCLAEKAIGLSKRQIERMVYTELAKPKNRLDCDIVDMCIELLAEIDNIELPQDVAPPQTPPFYRVKTVRKKAQ